MLIPFAATVGFTLSTGDGLKTVYGRYTFLDGSRSGDPLSASIILDTRAGIDSVYFTPPGQDFSVGDTILFFVRSEDDEISGTSWVSFPGVTQLRLTDDGAGGDVTADDGLYTARYVVPATISVSAGAVTGNFFDAAGNQAVPQTANQLLTILGEPPTPVILAGSVQSDTTVELTWSRYTGTDFARYVLYRDMCYTAIPIPLRLIRLISSLRKPWRSSITSVTIVSLISARAPEHTTIKCMFMTLTTGAPAPMLSRLSNRGPVASCQSLTASIDS
jgi:hypothetical protein